MCHYKVTSKIQFTTKSFNLICLFEKYWCESASLTRLKCLVLLKCKHLFVDNKKAHTQPSNISVLVLVPGLGRMCFFPLNLNLIFLSIVFHYFISSILHIFLGIILCNISHNKRLTTVGRCLFWRCWALQGDTVTSAALHLVLIAFELITPVSVKQCCQTSPAQQCFFSILRTPVGQMEASWAVECCIGNSCEDEVTLLTLLAEFTGLLSAGYCRGWQCLDFF